MGAPSSYTQNSVQYERHRFIAGFGINKSEAVRKALVKHPDKKPRWIAEMLVGKKIEVTPQVVSTIKSKMKSTGPIKKSSKSAGSSQSMGEVHDTIVFVRGIGGLDKAKQLIALLEEARNV